MELPKTVITENTLTSTVTSIEITSGIDASYNAYEFLVMNGQTDASDIFGSVTEFKIGTTGGSYLLRDNSLLNYGGNQSWNFYFGPHIINATGVNLLLRAVLLKPSGSLYRKTAFVHAGSNFSQGRFASGIVLVESTSSTNPVGRVRLNVTGGSWLAGTRYKLYGYK